MAEAAAAAIIAATGTTAISVSTLALVINVAIVVASTAYARDQEARAKYRARVAHNAGLKDRELTIRSGVANTRTIYGRDRVGGLLCLAHVTGAKKQFLHVVIAWSGEPCEAVEDIYFDDYKLPGPDADGWIRTGKYSKESSVPESIFGAAVLAGGTLTLPHTTDAAPVVSSYSVSEGIQEISFTHTVGTNVISNLPPGSLVNVGYSRVKNAPVVRIRNHTGKGQLNAQLIPSYVASNWLIAECPDVWTPQHVGRRVCYTELRLEFDQEVFGNVGFPNISATIKGKAVRDPRTGLSAWTENPALCIADWMRSDNGLGQLAEQVPDVEVIAAANLCDEPVPVKTVSGDIGFYESFVSGAAGWFGANATLAVSSGVVTLTATADDPYMQRDGLAIASSFHRYVRARIRRKSGSNWQGLVVWHNSQHAYSPAHIKNTTEPAYDSDGWGIAVWDMLGAGDWAAFTVTALRLDLSNFAGDTWEIDWVAVGGVTTQARYTFNGSFTSDIAPLNWLQDMAQAMMGAAVYSQGTWLIRSGAYRQPALTVTADDVLGPVLISPKTARQDLANAVRVTFRDPDRGYNEVQAPLVKNDFYATQDGGQYVTDMQLPFLCDSARAQRLGWHDLERRRQALTIQVPLSGRAYGLSVTDTVGVNLAIFGGTKVFEVVERIEDSASPLTYTLRETSPGQWANNYDKQTQIDLAPDTALPNPNVKPARLNNFRAVSDQTAVLDFGAASVMAQVVVRWNAITTDAAVSEGGRVEVEWKSKPNADWQAAPRVFGSDVSALISPAPSGRTIYIRGRARNLFGTAGDWVVITHNVELRTALSGGEVLNATLTRVYSQKQILEFAVDQVGGPPPFLSFTAPFSGSAVMVCSFEGFPGSTLGAEFSCSASTPIPNSTLVNVLGSSNSSPAPGGWAPCSGVANFTVAAGVLVLCKITSSGGFFSGDKVRNASMSVTLSRS